MRTHRFIVALALVIGTASPLVAQEPDRSSNERNAHSIFIQSNWAMLRERFALSVRTLQTGVWILRGSESWDFPPAGILRRAACDES